jgi:hypothetical protein
MLRRDCRSRSDRHTIRLDRVGPTRCHSVRPTSHRASSGQRPGSLRVTWPQPQGPPSPYRCLRWLTCSPKRPRPRSSSRSKTYSPVLAVKPSLGKPAPHRAHAPGTCQTVPVTGSVNERLWPTTPGLRPDFFGSRFASPGRFASGDSRSPAASSTDSSPPSGSAWACSSAVPSSPPSTPDHGGSLLGGRELVLEFAFNRSRASIKSPSSLPSKRSFSAADKPDRSRSANCRRSKSLRFISGPGGFCCVIGYSLPCSHALCMGG